MLDNRTIVTDHTRFLQRKTADDPDALIAIRIIKRDE